MSRRSPSPDISLSPHRGSGPWPFAGLVLLSGVLVALVELSIAAFSSTGLQGLHERNLWSMALSAGVIAALTGLLWSVTNRLGVALGLVTAVLLFTSTLHIRKLQLIGRPLLPWDFLAWRQVTALAPTLLPGGGAVVALLAGLFLLAVTAGVLAVVRGRPRYPLPRAGRQGLAVVALAYLLGVTFHQHLPLVPKVFIRFGVVHQVWDQRSNFQVNGLPLMLLWNWEGGHLRPGGEYSAEAVRSALGGDAKPPATAPAEPVDVVIIMAESLWDPTRLGVRLSADPLPFLRGLSATHTSGHLVSPVFGGGTANAEFELLTGLSTAFVPDDASPYQHYLLRPVEGLPSLFLDAGYRTTAIHPFHEWYWSRDKVYPLLGFEEFQSLSDFASARLEGPWVSDEALVDHILQALSDGQRPRFVFAVTMSTHGPYSLALTGAEEIQVLGELSPANTLLLTNYTHKLRQMDRALERLVRTLEARPRKTLLVVFGDHLPMLGPNYSLYREAGFLQEPWTEAQRERMAQVPVVLWSNYPLPRQQVDLGMSMLAPRILEAAGMRPHGFFSFLSELSRTVPVVRKDLLRNAAGEYLPVTELDAVAPVPGSSADWLRRYHLLTYDRLGGEGFSMPAARGREPGGGVLHRSAEGVTPVSTEVPL